MRGHLKVRFIYIDCVGLILYGLDLRISPALRYASVVLTRCVSVCLSVCHKSVFYRNVWTDLAGFWHGSFVYLPSETLS